MKTLYCRDKGFDCDAVVRAKTDQEVLNQAARHAQEVHGVNPTSQLAEDLSPLIIEE